MNSTEDAHTASHSGIYHVRSESQSDRRNLVLDGGTGGMHVERAAAIMDRARSSAADVSRSRGSVGVQG